MILNYATQDQVNEINSNLSDYDLSNTTLPSNTTFKQIIQLLIDKNFPLFDGYIVKNGVTKVAFDNTVYPINSSYNATSTQFTYANGYLYGAGVSQSNYSMGYSTSNKLDLSEYTVLKMKYKTSSTGSITTYSVDISDITLAYLVISLHNGGNSQNNFRLEVSTSKSNYGANRIKLLNEVATISSSSGVWIQDLWFE